MNKALLIMFSLLQSALFVETICAQSPIKRDEKIVFFPTAASLSADGSHWMLPIHGWVYEPENSIVRRKATASAFESAYGLRLTPAAEEIFSSRINLLIADNERGKVVRILIAGEVHVLPASGANGHFQGSVRLPRATVERAAKGGVLDYKAILTPEDGRSFSGYVLLVEPRGLSVISDIDDTVKISVVRERRELLSHTFYRRFIPVEGMSEYYQHLAEERDAAFHFVSSSPWQLFEPLHDFLQEHGFPPAAFHLKDFRLKDSTFLNLFKEGTETKPIAIRSILRRFPQRKFMLVGDSGEQDPEVYAALMREFPQQIELSLIRNVSDASREDERFRTAFQGIPPERWQLFSGATELAR